MFQFHGESEIRQEILREIPAVLRIARDTLTELQNEPRDEHVLKSSLDSSVLKAYLSTLIKAKRLFRTIVETCERGEAMVAEILFRSLYETTMAAEFILAPKISLAVTPQMNKDRTEKKDSNGDTRYNATTKKSHPNRKVLTQEFRANMVVCNIMLKYIRELRRDGSPTVDEQTQIEDVLKICHEVLTKEWTSAIYESGSYSGLSVCETARLLGGLFERYYDSVYRHQCNVVHFGDALRTVQLGKDETIMPQMFDTLDEIRKLLMLSAIQYLACFERGHEIIGFGPSFNTSHRLLEEIFNLVE